MTRQIDTVKAFRAFCTFLVGANKGQPQRMKGTYPAKDLKRLTRYQGSDNSSSPGVVGAVTASALRVLQPLGGIVVFRL